MTFNPSLNAHHDYSPCNQYRYSLLRYHILIYIGCDSPQLYGPSPYCRHGEWSGTEYSLSCSVLWTRKSFTSHERYLICEIGFQILGGYLWVTSVEGDPSGFAFGFVVCSVVCALAILQSFMIR